MKQRIKIVYDGQQDDEIDTRIAAVLEHPPLNFEWEGQGFDLVSKKRDITFTRKEIKGDTKV